MWKNDTANNKKDFPKISNVKNRKIRTLCFYKLLIVCKTDIYEI